MTTVVRAQEQPWRAGISLAVISKTPEKSFCAKPLVLEEIKDGEAIEPFMTIWPKEAQLLMDDLWHCGIRPSSGEGSVGQLGATQKHLEDMRTLVFKEKRG